MNADDDRSSPAAARPLRIVILPWLAFGHMIPALELAERLASRGHRVSFLTTPGNIALLPPPRARALDLVPLELPRVEGLDDGVENSTAAANPYALMMAFDKLAAPFAALLAADDDSRPDWVIVDTFVEWAAAAAHEHGVPCVMLLPSAAFIGALGSGARDRAELAGASVFEQMAAVDGPPPEIPRYEWEGNKKDFAPMPTSFFSRRCTTTLDKSTITASRGCPEWDLDDAFQVAAALLGKPLVPLGLVPPSPEQATGKDGEHAAVRWLDAQGTSSSVVYVALGSKMSLPLKQVHELAHGLELAGTPFLWALRKPSGVPDAADILPAGFQERTRGRGLVMDWVPQLTILRHPAVGAFLTHCGLASLIEGLQHGHPLILLPIEADQGANSRVMARRKVGIMVKRDDNDGSFDRHDLASAIRSVMVEEETRSIFVAKAREMQAIIADKELQDGYIDKFIQHLRSYTN